MSGSGTKNDDYDPTERGVMSAEDLRDSIDAYSSVEPVLRHMCDVQEARMVVAVRSKIGDLVAHYSTHLQWHEVVGDVALLRYVRAMKVTDSSGVAACVVKIRKHCEFRNLNGLDTTRRRLNPLDANFLTWSSADTLMGAKMTKILGVKHNHPNLNSHNIGIGVNGGADPIHYIDNSSDSTARVLNVFGLEATQENVVENYVRRMIQLDTLSRMYRRVSTVSFVTKQNPSGFWRILIPNTDDQKNYIFWCLCQDSLPGLQSWCHVIANSWAQSQFSLNTFNRSLTYCQLVSHGVMDYKESLKEFMSEEVIAFIENPSLVQLQVVLNPPALSSSSSAFSPSSSSVLKDQALPHSGSLEVSDFIEIVIEVDPATTKSIFWKFKVQGNHLVRFDYFFLQVPENSDTWDISTSTAFQIIPGMVPVITNGDQGTVQWKHTGKGLLILRFTNDNIKTIQIFYQHHKHA
jgi:hypothetical protein